MDPHKIYRETRQRLVALAPELDDAQLATMTLACPAWTVKDVYAHLSGLASDLTTGGHPRAGAPHHTARQVANRSTWGIHEICDEWAVTGPALEARIEAEPALRAPVIDIWTHEQDLANAAGVRSGRNGAGLELTLNAVWTMKRKLREAGIAPLRIVTEHVDWTIGDAEPGATLRTSSYEMARAILGRRSVDQILAYEWDGEPGLYLEHMAFFTPPPYAIVESP